MNWRRLYAALEILLTASLFAFIISGFLAFVIFGVVRVLADLGDDEAMLKIFVPLMVVLFVVLVMFLPSRLRAMGIVSDSPEKFGPWFKSDGHH